LLRVKLIMTDGLLVDGLNLAGGLLSVFLTMANILLPDRRRRISSVQPDEVDSTDHRHTD
jgi:hypothetical protein